MVPYLRVVVNLQQLAIDVNFSQFKGASDHWHIQDFLAWM
jgi:hypothetical protein